MVEGRLGAIRPSRTRIARTHSVVSDVAQLGAGGADGRGERRETKPAEALRPPVGARAVSYDDRLEPMDDADLIEMERAGRRCGVCRSGRGWRRFEMVRPPGREPVVLCGSCRARFGEDPPVGRKPAPEPAPSDASAVLPPKPQAEKGRTEPGRDRLRAALREMPGSFSTAMVARAAGLNKDKALARLQDLERHGEVHRVGDRWSTGPSADAVALAIDRLQARTSNLRIVRDRARVN